MEVEEVLDEGVEACKFNWMDFGQFVIWILVESRVTLVPVTVKRASKSADLKSVVYETTKGQSCDLELENSSSN